MDCMPKHINSMGSVMAEDVSKILLAGDSNNTRKIKAKNDIHALKLVNRRWNKSKKKGWVAYFEVV